MYNVLFVVLSLFFIIIWYIVFFPNLLELKQNSSAYKPDISCSSCSKQRSRSSSSTIMRGSFNSCRSKRSFSCSSSKSQHNGNSSDSYSNRGRTKIKGGSMKVRQILYLLCMLFPLLMECFYKRSFGVRLSALQQFFFIIIVLIVAKILITAFIIN